MSRLIQIVSEGYEKVIKRYGTEVLQYGHFAGFKPLRDLIANLHHAQVWRENADRFFPDTEAMIKWIDQPSLVPFLFCIPEEGRNTLHDFVIARMIEETRQEDGRCFETFRRINVFAKRAKENL